MQNRSPPEKKERPEAAKSETDDSKPNKFNILAARLVSVPIDELRKKEREWHETKNQKTP